MQLNKTIGAQPFDVISWINREDESESRSERSPGQEKLRRSRERERESRLSSVSEFSLQVSSFQFQDFSFKFPVSNSSFQSSVAVRFCPLVGVLLRVLANGE